MYKAQWGKRLLEKVTNNSINAAAFDKISHIRFLKCCFYGSLQQKRLELCQVLQELVGVCTPQVQWYTKKEELRIMQYGNIMKNKSFLVLRRL